MEETILQRRVIALGTQSYRGSIAIVSLFTLFGVGSLGYSFLMSDETEDSKRWMFRFLGIYFLVMSPILLFGVVYGRALRSAAKSRNSSKLLTLFHVWIIIDAITLVVIVVVVIVFKFYLLLVVLILFPLDVYRLRLIWNLIQECKEDLSFYGIKA